MGLNQTPAPATPAHIDPVTGVQVWKVSTAELVIPVGSKIWPITEGFFAVKNHKNLDWAGAAQAFRTTTEIILNDVDLESIPPSHKMLGYFKSPQYVFKRFDAPRTQVTGKGPTQIIGYVVRDHRVSWTSEAGQLRGSKTDSPATDDGWDNVLTDLNQPLPAPTPIDKKIADLFAEALVKADIFAPGISNDQKIINSLHKFMLEVHSYLDEDMPF